MLLLQPESTSGNSCEVDVLKLLKPLCWMVTGSTPSAQAAAWRAYIGWERSNPQRLDGAALAARVSLAYEQALMPLYHHPEVSHGFSYKSKSVTYIQTLVPYMVWKRCMLPLLDIMSLLGAHSLTGLCKIVWEALCSVFDCKSSWPAIRLACACVGASGQRL